MQLYFCDRCGNIIPEESVHSGEAGKGDEILCANCLPAASLQEEIVCDRCHTIFPAESLRQGEAAFSPRTSTAPAQLLCKRCAIVSRARRSESHDLRLLPAIFLAIAAVSLTIWAIWQWSMAGPEKREPEDKQLRQLTEESRTLRDMLLTMQQRDAEWRKEWQARQPATVSAKTPASEDKMAAEVSISPPVLQEMAAALLQKRVTISQRQLQGDLPARMEAMVHLCSLREEMSVPLLLEALRDTDPLVRSLSARLLGSLGAHASTGRLLIALKDPDPLVRKAVAQALTLLTGEQFVFFADVPPEKWQKLQKFKERQKEKNLRDKE